MTTEQKRELIQRGIELKITLNGRPAMIAGAFLPYARVSQLTGRLTVEYSWSAVELILSKGGTFKA